MLITGIVSMSIGYRCKPSALLYFVLDDAVIRMNTQRGVLSSVLPGHVGF